MSEQLPSIGDVFETRYKIDRILGRGGFGCVYEATDSGLNRTVAIKVLVPKGADYDERHAQRFIREAKSVARLDCPNIPKMYDYGRTDAGLLYAVYELVPGRDLTDIMDEGPMPESLVVKILVQVLEALAVAHDNGVLHRDIKPDNVRVFEYMNDPYCVKLIDFGIAQVEGDASLTRTGMAVGTPRFMAPEQFYGEPLGPHTDLFQLGLVAYEMLVGEPSNHMQLLMHRSAIELPDSVIVTPQVRGVVNGLLVSESSARFASARAVQRQLARASQPIVAPAAQSGPFPTAPAAQSGPFPTAPAAQSGPYPTPGSGPLTRPTSGPHGAPNASAVGALGSGANQAALSQSGPVHPGSGGFAAHVSPAGASQSGQFAAAEPAGRGKLVAAFILGGITMLGVGYLLFAPAPPAPVAEVVRQAPKVVPAVRITPLTDPAPPQARDVGLAAVDAADPPDAAPRGCGAAVEPGPQSFEGTGEFDDQIWLVHVPKSYDRDTPHPVVLFLHDDGGSNAVKGLRETRIGETADKYGFVIVAPTDSALAHGWSTAAALERARASVEQLGQHVCVDDEQIYVLGFGGGGKAVYSLGCDPWVAGVASVSYVPHAGPEICKTKRSVPMLHILGTKSGYMPVRGGSDCRGAQKPSFDQAESTWRAWNTCGDAAKPYLDSPHGVCVTWDCVEPTVSCRIDGGRRWPGTKPRSIDFLGCDGPGTKFPHNETIFTFFKQLGST